MAWPATDAGIALHPGALLGAAVASAVLAEVAIRYAHRRRLIDLPGQRRSHLAPTPRGGGIGIVVAVLLFGFLPWLPTEPMALPAAAAAWTLVAAVGWIDDHRPLGAASRLLVHLFAAGVVAGTTMLAGGGATLVAVALATIAIAWSVNLHNFMDGIDGILSMQAVFVLVVLALALLAADRPASAQVVAVAAAATLGFVPFNAPKARIFMGDVGSGALGLLVGAASLWAWHAQALDLPQLLVLSSAFAIDATATLVSRFVRGRRWYSAHREHLYQWLVRRGFSHMQATGLYLAWNLVVAAPAVAAVSLLDLAGSVYSWAVAAVVHALGLAIWLGSKRTLALRN